MNNKDRMLGYLGLGKRAGNLIYGMDAVIASIKKKEVYWIGLSNDIGSNTKRKLEIVLTQINETTKEKIKINTLSFVNSVQLGKVIGKQKVSIIAITNQTFAKGLEQFEVDKL